MSEVSGKKQVGTFHVGAQDVKILEDPNLRDEPEYDGVGKYKMVPEPEIHIASDLPRRTRYQTLLHELLHHLDEAYGLGLGERKIRALEQLLLMCVRQNPDYFTDVLEVFGNVAKKCPNCSVHPRVPQD